MLYLLRNQLLGAFYSQLREEDTVRSPSLAVDVMFDRTKGFSPEPLALKLSCHAVRCRLGKGNKERLLPRGHPTILAAGRYLSLRAGAPA